MMSGLRIQASRLSGSENAPAAPARVEPLSFSMASSCRRVAAKPARTARSACPWRPLVLVCLSVVLLVTRAGMSLADPGEEHTTTRPLFDHVVIAVPELAPAAATMASVIGVPLRAGGEHPGIGSANFLLSLGDEQYIELIGPQADLREPTGFVERLEAVEGIDLRTFAVAATDLERIEAVAKAHGVRTSGIAAGSRRTGDGRLLRWRRLYTYSDRFAGLVPFFIDWLDTPHPAAEATGEVQLGGLTAVHPKAAALQALYDALGIEVAVRPGSRPGLLLELTTPKGPALILGSGLGLAWE